MNSHCGTMTRGWGLATAPAALAAALLAFQADAETPQAVPADTKPARPQPSAQTQIVIVLPPGTLTWSPVRFPTGTFYGVDRIVLPPGEPIPAGYVLPPGATAQTVPAKLRDPFTTGTGTPDLRGKKPKVGPAPRERFYTLPANLFDPDGTVNQKALTDALKASRESLNTVLGTRFQMRETAHFIILSEAADTVTERYVGTCEFMYSNLQRLFGLAPDERAWDGKCVLILFSTADKYGEFARRFDAFPANFRVDEYTAYHAVSPGPARGPRIVHMCFSPKGSEPAALVHEGAHAMLLIRTKPGIPPRWLNEGIAVFMEVACQPKQRTPHLAGAIMAARMGDSVMALANKKSIGDLSAQDYCIAYSLIDYLQQHHRGKLQGFILAFKEGKTADQAMQDVYGFGLPELERRWRIWATSPETLKRLDKE